MMMTLRNYVSFNSYYFKHLFDIIIAGIDLASSVEPLQRLCTISLTEMQHFLSKRAMD